MPPRQHLPARYTDVFDSYTAALATAPLDEHTRRAYASRVRGFLAWLDEAAPSGGDPLTEAHGRDFAARDYRSHLKTVLKRSPATTNAHLVALDHFFTHLGLGPASVRRDEPEPTAPRALEAREQKRFLRAVEKRPLARDRAIGRLLFYSGLRVSELVALDTGDVPLSARKGGPGSFRGKSNAKPPRLVGWSLTVTPSHATGGSRWPPRCSPRPNSTNCAPSPTPSAPRS